MKQKLIDAVRWGLCAVVAALLLGGSLPTVSTQAVSTQDLAGPSIGNRNLPDSASVFLASHAESQADVRAFPGAEGFGANALGGRGGRAIMVTNLNDSGPGSLRDAIDAEGPRTVIFRIAGTIELESRIDIANPYITIAGQTAPGGGITLKLDPAYTRSPLRIMTHDVILRYIRSRPGPSTVESDILDALTISAGHDIIVDHCSFSWATDEVVNTWNDVHDITVQWSIISEGLNDSTHPKGPHSKGMLIGSEGAERISVHHNLFAHNRKRNPKVNIKGVADVVNNVVYNARFATMVQDTYGTTQVNYVGNYVKHGIDSFYDYDLRYWNDGNSPAEIYVRDNIGPKRSSSAQQDKWVVREEDRQFMVDTPHAAPPVDELSPFAAYGQVLANAGATLPMRDAVDERVISDVINGTGRVIDHPDQVGGWPKLCSGSVPVDTDLDGMPNYWEAHFGLNVRDSADGPLDADVDGYTNLEEYLNETLPVPLPVEPIGNDQDVTKGKRSPLYLPLITNDRRTGC